MFAQFFLIIFLLLIPLAIYIWFNVSMQNAMNAISKENRKMEGGLIWLNLIPILNLVWPLIFNNALKVSYTDEFQKKRIRENVNLTSGLIYPSAQLLSLLITFFLIFSTANSYESSYYSGYNGRARDAYESILIGSVIVGLLGLLSSVLWIVFWVNTMKLKNMLNLNEGGNGQVIDQYVHAEINHPITPQTINPSANNFPTEEQVISQSKPSQEQPKEVSSIEKIKKYHDMLNEGLINEADFDRIKKELLNQ